MILIIPAPEYLWEVVHFKDKHIDPVTIKLVWGVGWQHREHSSELGAAGLLFFPRTKMYGVSFAETDV